MDEFTVWDGFDRDEDTQIRTLCRGNTVFARFFGPDREANAQLFLRAQHMGELVKIADFTCSVLNFETSYGAVQAETVNTALEPLRTILAKIGGGE